MESSSNMNTKAASTAKKKGGYGTQNNAKISAGKASTTLIDESMRKTIAALRDSSDPQTNYLSGHGNSGNGFHQTSGNNSQNSQAHQQSFDAIVNSRPAPTDDQNLSYYQEFCRLFIANNVLQTQMKELLNEKGDLMGNLNKLEKRSEELLGKSGQLDSLQPKKSDIDVMQIKLKDTIDVQLDRQPVRNPMGESEGISVSQDDPDAEDDDE